MVMRRLVLALAAGSLAGGIIVALIGLPYGRVDLTAFAELYHGPTDTTGTFHVALDCDPAAAGTQDFCALFASGLSMGVTVGNSTGASSNIAALNFRVTNNRQDLFNPTTVADTNLDSNPDFDQSLAGPGWSCTPPPPNRDEDPSPGTSVSFLSCATGYLPGAIPLPVGPTHTKVATVLYNGSGPIGPFQTATFTLSDVNIFDDTATELMSCNPVNTTAGPCFGATVDWGLPPPPTLPPTATPTATVTPVPDQDFDGVPDATDNCPTTPNPQQQNYDANFVSNAPVYTTHDYTRASSDTLGDECDGDIDGDGLFGGVLFPETCGGNDFNFDIDGDRFHDGAECALGSDPNSAGSTPPIASCGATTDGDGDRLTARVEYCFYNTSDGGTDSDGDGTHDGCEAASLNTDTIVNSGDQLLLSQEMMRVPPPAKLVNFDINKDGAINAGDQLMQALLIMPPGQCP
jgi:hypothetical protein